MPTLTWDQDTQRLYETGVKKVVLYVKAGTAYPAGVAWNGVTNISESPSGAEPTALYANDIKYLNLMSNEEFGASIEAYTYPDEFAECDGSAALVEGVMIGQQARKTFGLLYILFAVDVSGFLLMIVEGSYVIKTTCVVLVVMCQQDRIHA